MEKLIKGALTRQELASLYGICTKTLKKWIEGNNIKLPSGLITPQNQKKIFKRIGIPKNSK